MSRDYSLGELNYAITQLLHQEFEPTRKESFDQIAAKILAKVAEHGGQEVGTASVEGQYAYKPGEITVEFTNRLGAGKWKLYAVEVLFNSATDKCPCCGKIGCYWQCK